MVRINMKHAKSIISVTIFSLLIICILLILNPPSRETLYIALSVPAILLGWIAWKKICFQRILFSLSKRILYTLQPHFKKDTYILCDNLYEKHAGCVDTYCIFEEMQSRGISSYYVIWKENIFYEKLRRENKLKNVIVLKKSVAHNFKRNFEFWFKVFPILSRTKVLLISFSLWNPKVGRTLYKNKYIIFHQVGHACTYFKMFPLKGEAFSRSTYNKYACWNETEAEAFVKYGKWKRENLPITGCCRCDQLKRIPHEKKTIFIMFTWRTSFAPHNKEKFTTSLINTKYYRGIKAFMHDINFRKMIKENNIRIVYSFHHASLDLSVSAPDPSDLCGRDVEIADSTNIASYIAISDLLVTDYSSVFFDFSFLNIPTVFYRPDFDDESLTASERRDMAHARGHDKELFNVFYKKEEAIACIRKYVENDFILEDAYKKKLEKFFPVRENITEKFIKYLEAL